MRRGSPCWKSVRPQPRISRQSPVKAMLSSSSTKVRQPSVWPGVARTSQVPAAEGDAVAVRQQAVRAPGAAGRAPPRSGCPAAASAARRRSRGRHAHGCRACTAASGPARRSAPRRAAPARTPGRSAPPRAVPTVGQQVGVGGRRRIERAGGRSACENHCSASSQGEPHMSPRAVASLLLMLAASCPPALRAATPCQGLASLKLPDTTITAATEVAAGAFVADAGGDGGNGNGGAAGRAGRTVFASLPAFCRVAGVVRPSPDSNIRFETWMPLQGWNQRFQGVGNGGFAGTISYPAMAAALADGYATGSTDTGHGPEGGMDAPQWALGHPGADHRLRLPRCARDDGEEQGRDGRLLRLAAALFLLGGMLRRRPPGHGRGAAIPDGLRRHRRRRAGVRLHPHADPEPALQKILREDPAAFIPGSKMQGVACGGAGPVRLHWTA